VSDTAGREYLYRPDGTRRGAVQERSALVVLGSVVASILWWSWAPVIVVAGAVGLVIVRLLPHRWVKLTAEALETDTGVRIRLDEIAGVHWNQPGPGTPYLTIATHRAERVITVGIQEDLFLWRLGERWSALADPPFVDGEAKVHLRMS